MVEIALHPLFLGFSFVYLAKKCFLALHEWPLESAQCLLSSLKTARAQQARTHAQKDRRNAVALRGISGRRSKLQRGPDGHIKLEGPTLPYFTEHYQLCGA